MAELQTFVLDVVDERQESDSLTVRLERDEGRKYSAQAEQRGALVSQCEGHTPVEALTSCLKQVGVFNATRRVIAFRQEGDALINATDFAKTCRDVGISIDT